MRAHTHIRRVGLTNTTRCKIFPLIKWQTKSEKYTMSLNGINRFICCKRSSDSFFTRMETCDTYIYRHFLFIIIYLFTFREVCAAFWSKNQQTLIIYFLAFHTCTLIKMCVYWKYFDNTHI